MTWYPIHLHYHAAVLASTRVRTRVCHHECALSPVRGRPGMSLGDARMENPTKIIPCYLWSPLIKSVIFVAAERSTYGHGCNTLETSKVMSGGAPTSYSAHSWWLYSATPLRNQATAIMTLWLTQSHYPDAEPTSPFPILIMLSARLGTSMYQSVKSLVWLDWELNSWSPDHEARALQIQPRRAVCGNIIHNTHPRAGICVCTRQMAPVHKFVTKQHKCTK